MARTYCSHRPSLYARRKLSEMRTRWSGALGAAVRRFMPVIFPSVPPEMGVAFTSNGVSASEKHCTGFCALGYYQTPERPYEQLATSGAVRDLLGRSASVSGWETDIDGQTVVGLLNYRDREARNVTTRIPANLRPQDPASIWSVACSIFGFVEGGGAVAAIQRHAALLGQANERERFAALCLAVAEDVAAGRDSRGIYPIVRAMQRFAVGRLLAQQTGGNVDWWFVSPSNDYAEHWIAIGQYGQPDDPSCVPTGSLVAPSAEQSAAGTASVWPYVLGTLVIAGGAATGWWWWQQRQQKTPGTDNGF